MINVVLILTVLCAKCIIYGVMKICFSAGSCFNMLGGSGAHSFAYWGVGVRALFYTNNLSWKYRNAGIEPLNFYELFSACFAV